MELPEVPNIKPQYDDIEHYKLIRCNPELKDVNIVYKLIIVGHSNTGKTCIIKRYCQDVYQPFITTVGIDFEHLYVEFKGKNIDLMIWDTAGSEKYRSLFTSYYRGAHGIFIVYDITNFNSFIKLDDWMKDIKEFSDPNTVKILIGSKCDDTSNRKISVEEGQNKAEEYKIPIFEVSSKTNVNINKLYYTMISKIYEVQEQQLTTIPKIQNLQSTKDVIKLTEVNIQKIEEKRSSKDCSC